MTKKALKVPSSRVNRAGKIGSLLARVAGNVAYNGTKQLLSGSKPSMSDLLLTPNNLQKLADQLASKRGAAMKLGQLLSMDTGEILPEELSNILAKLRDNAHAMPHKQLIAILKSHWGDNWVDNFAYFNLTPFACASIGQVHIAHNDNGEKLAVKLQYPGVRDSINSDVDNLNRVMKLSGQIPSHIDLTPLLNETKKQLLVEADYQQEAGFITQFREVLDPTIFTLPKVQPLSNRDILIMSFIEGTAIEQVTHLPQQTRDYIAHSLFSLFFKELFDLKLMQTDPNFANYLYCSESNKIGLLDFGATRDISDKISDSYRSLFKGLFECDHQQIEQAAKGIGFFEKTISPDYLATILHVFELASAPIRHQGPYDFGTSDIANQIKQLSSTVQKHKNQWHTPPVDALFIHRKIAGLYLVARKLNAT
jgi:predicted unusual protein kinase regulating ubiquinone biosynthesis (AarF/ABC1/UbiB family)